MNQSYSAPKAAANAAQNPAPPPPVDPNDKGKDKPKEKTAPSVKFLGRTKDGWYLFKVGDKAVRVGLEPGSNLSRATSTQFNQALSNMMGNLARAMTGQSWENLEKASKGPINQITIFINTFTKSSNNMGQSAYSGGFRAQDPTSGEYVIHFNPFASVTENSNGHLMPQDAMLFHELAHSVYPVTKGQAQDPNWRSVIESRVVHEWENPYREKHDEPDRNGYDSATITNPF